MSAPTRRAIPVESEEQLELLLTNIVIHTIVAGYRGKLAAYEVLAELGVPDHSGHAITAAILEAALSWQELSADGVPLLTRADRVPISSVAEEIWWVFDRLKRDLHRQAMALRPYCDVNAPARGREAAILLVAALARLATTRQYHAQSLVRVGGVFGLLNVFRERRRSLLQCAAELRQVRIFVEALRARTALTPGFHKSLRQLAVDLPTAFLIQVSDMHVILGRYNGQLTFEMMAIDAGEAAHWRALGFSAEDAGYWSACGVHPEETATWMAAELDRPDLVGIWRSRKFTPEEAAGWSTRGFSAQAAMAWRDHGFVNPMEARDWRNCGFADLHEAVSWSAAGFSPAEARRWQAAAFRAEEARQWIQNGVRDPATARAKSNAKPSEPGGEAPTTQDYAAVKVDVGGRFGPPPTDEYHAVAPERARRKGERHQSRELVRKKSEEHS